MVILACLCVNNYYTYQLKNLLHFNKRAACQIYIHSNLCYFQLFRFIDFIYYFQFILKSFNFITGPFSKSLVAIVLGYFVISSMHNCINHKVLCNIPHFSYHIPYSVSSNAVNESIVIDFISIDILFSQRNISAKGIDALKIR